MSEKSCLITTSLISSISWYKSAPPSWKERAKADLENSLQRIYTENEPAKRGIAFEDKLYDTASTLSIPMYGIEAMDADTSHVKCSEEFREMLMEVAGGYFQKKEGVNVEIAGENCYLYGKYDAAFDTIIKDVKTTGNYKKGKYLGTFQHLMYCYISGVKSFRYVVAEWDEYPKINRVYKEDYKVESEKALEIDVHQTVAEALDFLKSNPKYWAWYKDKFCLY